MSASEKRLDVVFAIHDRTGLYWLNTAVALASVAMHARVPVRFHVLHDETLPERAGLRLRTIGRQFGHPVELRPCKPPAGANGKRFDHFSVATSYRLFIPEMFGHRDRVVYLDSDLVANGVDVGELAAALPAGMPMAAALDSFIGITPAHAPELREMGLDVASYINSGVLVLNPRLIGAGLIGKFVEFLARFPKAKHMDQDFLNVHLRGRIHILEERFNLQTCTLSRSLMHPLPHYAGKIVHYVGQLKPLDNALGVAMLPFWMHAGCVPEIAEALPGVKPIRYIHPDQSHPHTVHLQAQYGMVKKAAAQPA